MENQPVTYFKVERNSDPRSLKSLAFNILYNTLNFPDGYGTEKADFAGQPFVCCESVVYWSEDESEGVFLRHYKMLQARPCAP